MNAAPTKETPNETALKCYCGRLATGLHTMNCSRFKKKLQAKITARYRAALKTMKASAVKAAV